MNVSRASRLRGLPQRHQSKEHVCIYQQTALLVVLEQALQLKTFLHHFNSSLGIAATAEGSGTVSPVLLPMSWEGRREGGDTYLPFLPSENVTP